MKDDIKMKNTGFTPEWYDQLYETLINSEIDEFETQLLRYTSDVNFDINHVYGDPEYGTLVDIACTADSLSNRSGFVRLLIKCGANINFVNKVRKKAPLHFAVESSDLKTLQCLLDVPNIDVNILDLSGRTALHLACELEKLEQVKLLLHQQNVMVNIPDGKKRKPLQLAREKGNMDIVSALLEHEDTVDSMSDLFSSLYAHDLESFERLIKDDPQLVNSDDGYQTFLQYACQRNLHEFASLLLRWGADINRTCKNNDNTGLMLACRQGHYEIVKLLIDNDSVSLAPNAPLTKVNINHTDAVGNTALHYAAKTGNQDIIFLLLDHGAFNGRRNNAGEPPLAEVSPKILEAYFDRRISTNGKSPGEDEYGITLDYTFLVPPKTPTSKCDREIRVDVESNVKLAVPISKPLFYISQSLKLRPLLIHPVLTSFIYLKWCSVCRFFYYNLAIYASFWLSLTVYILFFFNSDGESPSDKKNSTVTWQSPPPQESKTVKGLLWYALVLLVMILLSRELFQLFVSPTRYARYFENWLEIPLIVITGMILFGELSKELRNQISAVGILLSWGELFLLVGRHPALSTKAEMFKIVAMNLLKFLVLYVILILAFVLSFYSLLKDSAVEDNNFLGIGNSAFHTVIMFTGEFDSNPAKLNQNPAGSLLFVLFVFLIVIVLFNLLNGLAVSDTQIIRKDAELFGYISRVEFITFMETTAICYPTFIQGFAKYVEPLFCCVPYSFLACSFPDSVTVLPNKGNRVDLVDTEHPWQRQAQDMDDTPDSCVENLKTITLKESIVKAAKDVLHRRLEENRNDEVEVKKTLDEYGQRLDRGLEVMTQQSREIFDKMYEMMEQMHRWNRLCYYPGGKETEGKTREDTKRASPVFPDLY